LLPYLLQSERFGLPTYGVMAAAGLVLGLLIAVRYARLDGLDEDKAWNLGVITILSGVLGAKVLMVINDWDYYARNLGEIFSLTMLQAGGVWYGGFLGGVAAGIWYVRRHRLPILRTWDAFTPGITLGHALGRLGCFAAGCCYGKPTDMPWGVVFTDPAAYKLNKTPLGVRMHPTQLYEFLAEITVFLILVLMIRAYRRSAAADRVPGGTALASFAGKITGAYAFLYGIARFMIEFLRDDPGRGSVFGGALSGTQLVSIGLVILGGALWLRRAPRTASAAPATI
jgi:phosphatidylglycerol---prolipoprotein diacylglyceryl transferase